MEKFYPLDTRLVSNVSSEQAISNINANLKRFSSLPVRLEATGRPLSIIAGGPSLKRYWPFIIQDIDTHHVMALNNTYRFLLDRGIVPDYFVLLDAKPDKVDYLKRALDNDSEAAKHALKHTVHYVADQVNPNVIDFLESVGANTVVYLTDNHYCRDHIHEFGFPPEQREMLGGGGTVGWKGVCLATLLGYRKLYLYGYDSSFEGDARHAYDQHNQARMIEVKIEDSGKLYQTVTAMAAQAKHAPWMFTHLRDEYGCEINLRCDGLLPDVIRYANTNKREDSK